MIFVRPADEPERLAKAPDDFPRHRAAAILTQIDLGDWDVLIDPTAEELALFYADGLQSALPLVGFTTDDTANDIRERFGLGPIAGGDEIPAIVNQVNDLAVAWARERAAELVTQIEENTRGMLRDTIADAVEGGWSNAELADEIAGSIGFSDARAAAISRTEHVGAHNQGELRGYRAARDDLDLPVRKIWLTADDDLVSEDCVANAAAGAIQLDEDFPSGDDAPPAHTNCRCAIAPVVQQD